MENLPLQKTQEARLFLSFNTEYAKLQEKVTASAQAKKILERDLTKVKNLQEESVIVKKLETLHFELQSETDALQQLFPERNIDNELMLSDRYFYKKVATFDEAVELKNYIATVTEDLKDNYRTIKTAMDQNEVFRIYNHMDTEAYKKISYAENELDYGTEEFDKEYAAGEQLDKEAKEYLLSVRGAKEQYDEMFASLNKAESDMVDFIRAMRVPLFVLDKYIIPNFALENELEIMQDSQTLNDKNQELNELYEQLDQLQNQTEKNPEEEEVIESYIEGLQREIDNFPKMIQQKEDLLDRKQYQLEHLDIKEIETSLVLSNFR